MAKTTRSGFNMTEIEFSYSPSVPVIEIQPVHP